MSATLILNANAIYRQRYDTHYLINFIETLFFSSLLCLVDGPLNKKCPTVETTVFPFMVLQNSVFQTTLFGSIKLLSIVMLCNLNLNLSIPLYHSFIF